MSDTHNDIPEKLLERIQKLLALAGNNPSAEEAASAMAKAQSLLADYNLSIADIAGRSAKDKPSNVKDAPVTMRYAAWAVRMVAAIAELYMCRVLFTKTGQRTARYYFIGKPHNIAVAKLFAAKITEDSHSMAGKRRRELRMPNSYATAFLHSAADQITRRCAKLVYEAKQGNMQGMSASRALVVASLYDQEAELNKALVSPDVKTANLRRTKIEDFLGTLHGAVYGDTVAIQQTVEDGRKADTPQA